MSHKLPHSGIPVTEEYTEIVREYFPKIPRAAITQYWKHNASISEIRADLEKLNLEQKP